MAGGGEVHMGVIGVEGVRQGGRRPLPRKEAVVVRMVTVAEAAEAARPAVAVAFAEIVRIGWQARGRRR
jgi:hypothetical protein